MNKLPLIAGGALAACLAGYFGLSSYSSAQAEKRLEDWVYEHQLDDKLSWSKVSASPFGGSLSIHDLTFDVGGKEPLLRAAELHISEVISDEQRSRMRLRLQGIEADQQAMGGLRQLGQMGGFNRQLNQATRFAPAVNTGLREMPAFNLALFVDIDDDDSSLVSELELELPELFSTRLHYQLNGLRNLNRELQRFTDNLADLQENPLLLVQETEDLALAMQRAELGSLQVSLRDLGMLKRSAALYQRYNTPLDPTAGSADKQREKHLRQQVAEQQRECSEELGRLPRGLEDTCELLGQLALGEIRGLSLSLEPEERVRLSDLERLDSPARINRLLDRLNPQLESL